MKGVHSVTVGCRWTDFPRWIEIFEWIAWRLRVLHTHRYRPAHRVVLRFLPENPPCREIVWKSFFFTNLTLCQPRSCGQCSDCWLRIVRRRFGNERPYAPIEPCSNYC